MRLPKIGWVKFRDTRPIDGKVPHATVSHDALGWHVSFACEVDRPITEPPLSPVGIDRGIAVTSPLSAGEMLTMPASLAVLDRRRQLRRCARLSARRARVRRDFTARPPSTSPGASARP